MAKVLLVGGNQVSAYWNEEEMLIAYPDAEEMLKIWRIDSTPINEDGTERMTFHKSEEEAELAAEKDVQGL